MRPGTFAVGPLRVKLPRGVRYTSYVLSSSDLTCEKRTIAARSVQALTETGPRSLAKAIQLPADVPKDGELEVPLLLCLQVVFLPGTYTGTLTLQALSGEHRKPQELEIPLQAEVSCEVMHAIQGNQAYFHFGRSDESLTARFDGRVHSPDAAMHLQVSVTKGRIDQMPLTAPMTSRAQPEDDSLRLRWALSESGGPRRDPDMTDDDGDSLSWRLQGTPGELTYQLSCEAIPCPAQTAGEYSLEATLSLVPIL